MSPLIVFVFMLFPLMCAREFNDTPTANVTTALQLLPQQFGRRGNASANASTALALFKKRANPCDKTSDTTRKVWTSLEAASYGLIYYGSAAAVVGTITAPAGFGIPLAITGGLLTAIGIGIQVVNRFAGPDSKETEAVRCLDHEFKTFKDNMTANMEKVETMFKELQEKITTQYEGLMAGQEKIMKMIKELEQAFFNTKYLETTSRLTTLKENFEIFLNPNGSLDVTDIRLACQEYDPGHVLVEIEQMHMDQVLNISKDYVLLKNRCTQMGLHIMHAAIFAVECFAISETGKDETAMKLKANQTGRRVDRLINKMRDAMLQMKYDTFNNEIIPKLTALMDNGESCVQVRERTLQYLRSEHPWAEWLLKMSGSESILKMKRYGDDISDGLDSTRLNSTYKFTCYMMIMRCEYYDTVTRKENVQRFTETLKTFDMCPWLQNSADVRSMLDVIGRTSTEPVTHPNSPRYWSNVLWSIDDSNSTHGDDWHFRFWDDDEKTTNNSHLKFISSECELKNHPTSYKFRGLKVALCL